MDAYTIEQFDYTNPEHVDAIIKIHTEVLPDSFIVKMGGVFMREFYYKILLQKGNLVNFLFRLNGEVVGIIVTNKKPYSLIRSSSKGLYHKLIYILMKCMVANPKRIMTLIEVLLYKPDPLLKKFEETGLAFEILTIGVTEKFRSIKIEGVKISHWLLYTVCKYYDDLKAERITGQILKSNIAAQKFYANYQANYIQSTVSESRVIMDLPVSNVLTPLSLLIKKK
jgi:hypothetical protein